MDFPDISRLGDLTPDDFSYGKILLLALLGAGFFLFTDLTVISVLAVLSIALPVALRRMGLKMIGIELVTLTAVLTGMTIGAGAGALAGFLLMTAHMVAGQYSGTYILWVIPGYALAGFLAGTVNASVTIIGIGSAVGLNSTFTLLTAGINPEGLPYFIPHAVGNVLFNAFIFLYIAPELLTVI